MSEKAHLYSFAENRPPEFDRITFALVAEVNGKLAGWVTCRELDKESVYWQYGGAFPTIEKTIHVFGVYEAFFNKIKELGYKRMTTYMQNTNIAMIKLGFKYGLRIIGVRFFNNEIFCELYKEL